MSTLIHLEVDLAFQTLNSLEASLLESKDALNDLTSAVHSLSGAWKSPAADKFMEESATLQKKLNTQFEEIENLLSRGRYEVNEWVEADAKLWDSPVQVSPAVPAPKDTEQKDFIDRLAEFYKFLEELKKWNEAFYAFLLALIVSSEKIWKILFEAGVTIVGVLGPVIAGMPGPFVPYTPGMPIDCRLSPVQPVVGGDQFGPGLIINSPEGPYFVEAGGAKTPLRYDADSGCYSVAQPTSV